MVELDVLTYLMRTAIALRSFWWYSRALTLKFGCTSRALVIYCKCNLSKIKNL